MVERIAILKLLPPHATPEGRAEVARLALEALRPLPGVVTLTVGVPADDASLASWDVMVTVRCATMADLGLPGPPGPPPLHRGGRRSSDAGAQGVVVRGRDALKPGHRPGSRRPRPALPLVGSGSVA
ncbi:MAG: hypothetical protein ACKOCT_14450 [Alphaproteobacteria bacterium]